MLLAASGVSALASRIVRTRQASINAAGLSPCWSHRLSDQFTHVARARVHALVFGVSDRRQRIWATQLGSGISTDGMWRSMALRPRDRARRSGYRRQYRRSSLTSALCSVLHSKPPAITARPWGQTVALLHQRFISGHIVGLALAQLYGYRKTYCVAAQVDRGREPAARTAESLPANPPFWRQRSDAPG